jgi:hypothetical protein
VGSIFFILVTWITLASRSKERSIEIKPYSIEQRFSQIHLTMGCPKSRQSISREETENRHAKCLIRCPATSASASWSRRRDTDDVFRRIRMGDLVLFEDRPDPGEGIYRVVEVAELFN